MLFMIFLILLTLLTYIFGRWIYMKHYWSKRGVPNIPPHPLFGSMTFLQKENAAVWFRQISRKFEEPYVGIWVFWRPGLVINSPDLAKNILIKDQANFRNRLASSGNTDPVGRLNLFSLNDPLWSVLRKHLSFIFTSSKLRVLQNLITRKALELVQRIEKERKKQEPMSLRDIMTDYSTDVVGTASFGLVSDATLTGRSHMRNITEDFMKFSFLRGLSWCSNFFYPEVADFFRFKMFPSKSTEYMRKILRIIIAERGGIEKKITNAGDLLDMLIKIKQDSGEELDMTEDMILAQAAVFLQGGFETTATALSFDIYELAHNTEVQNKLYKELHEAKQIHGDGLLDANVLSQLIYLNCVVNEGLRKYPIFGWLDRVALHDYVVDDQLTIKAGTVVYINMMGIHYNPEYFPDPETFNPDRFLPQNRVDNKHFVYMPFGEGPRKCIGQRLGLSNVRHALTAIILEYEVRPLPNFPKPSDIQLEKKGLLTIPAETLAVEFVPRKKI